MIVRKITTGYIVQVFDTELNEFISQEFVAGDDCVYENEMGEPADHVDQYLPFDMVQPDIKARGKLGSLYVETDYDFYLELNGKQSTGHEFTLEIDSMEDIDNIKVLPVWAKSTEILEALEAIKKNPNKPFNNTGGNRGATWLPRS